MPTKVLIIDDEVDTCRMFVMGLKIAGLQSEFALSGAEALDRFAAIQPDAVVLDLMLPDLDGYEVARRLRASPGAASVPIFIVSATADAAAESKCFAAGATAFMRKPVQFRDLAERIKKAIE